MKYSTLVFLSLLVSSAYSQTTKKALFVGNSYTFYHDLPSLTAQVAESMGDSLVWQMIAPEGYTLEDHTTQLQTLVALGTEEWDFVVFQEQSQIPALSNEIFETDVAPFAQELCQLARDSNTCVKPVFFMTWGRKNGDTDNCLEFPWVCTYEGQQDSLLSRYMQLSIANDAWCAPVGEAWRSVMDVTNGDLELYAPDGSHPSYAGTYIASCVFYATFFGNSPVGAVIPNGISQDDGEIIQIIAANTVIGEEETWNFNPVVWADLIFNVGPLFTEMTLNASFAVDSVLIEINDQQLLWQPGDNGAYTFDGGWTPYFLTAFSECGEYQLLDSLYIATDLLELQGIPDFAIFPNPTVGPVQIEFPHQGQWSLEVYDSLGKMVLSRSIQTADSGFIVWDLSELGPGLYFLVASGEQRGVARFCRL